MTDLGPRIEDWTPPPRPGPPALEGRTVRLERLGPGHAAALHAAFAEDASGSLWDYMAHGPFAGAEDFAAWVGRVAEGGDPFYYALLDRAGPAGVASWLRITPEHGVIEVGGITFAPRLMRTRAATEAMVLMADWAFAAGYRRYEWKCDALNGPSRRAAVRLGFTFEGVFRQHMVVKGRSRDTAWYAIIDQDRPALRAAYAAWLSPANFDAAGRQRQRLSDLTAAAAP